MKKYILAKKIIIIFFIIVFLSGCSSYFQTKPPKKEAAFEYQNHPDLLSDDLDTRFQQLFYYELDQPTVEEPFPPAPYSSPEQLYGGNGGNEPPARLFKREVFYPHLLSKGAFFFVEPPYGYLAVGLNRCIVRGIYNIQIEEEEGYEPSVLSAFSMEIELQDCSLTDVVLEYRGTPQFHLQNQKIPLTIEETDGILSITADLDRVSPIVTDLGNNLIFRGVITYKGEEYSFSSRI